MVSLGGAPATPAATTLAMDEAEDADRLYYGAACLSCCACLVVACLVVPVLLCLSCCACLVVPVVCVSCRV